MRHAIIFIAALVLVGALAVGGWYVQRWFNYYFGYESQTRATICEMVRPEALLERCD